MCTFPCVYCNIVIDYTMQIYFFNYKLRNHGGKIDSQADMLRTIIFFKILNYTFKTIFTIFFLLFYATIFWKY
jgi:hypothetical protein